MAKLDGFLSNPAQVIQRRNSDSVPDRYARAVAYYRQPDLPKALGLVDGLIAEYPQDPYFYELKGQMLFENGRVMESIEPNREALRYRPDSALLRYGLARSLHGKRQRQGSGRSRRPCCATLSGSSRTIPALGAFWASRRAGSAVRGRRPWRWPSRR